MKQHFDRRVEIEFLKFPCLAKFSSGLSAMVRACSMTVSLAAAYKIITKARAIILKKHFITFIFFNVPLAQTNNTVIS